MVTIDKFDNRIPVNSITLPARFVKFATEWHSGIHCMLYKVSSVGTIKIAQQYSWRYYYYLWCELLATLEDLSEYITDSDKEVYEEFIESVNGICELLRHSYTIED